MGLERRQGPVLLSVNVGLPKDVEWQGRTVYTGVWKRPVSGPVMARRLNLDGDGQGDKEGHGGEQRAVLVYQIDSYRYWEKYLGRNDFTYGEFGENLTVDGLADEQVCIGDRYRIGEAEFEVTQPRVTCYRVGMRLGEPDLPALLVSHHRPGFYMRVITEGRVEAGDPIVKTRSGPEGISVTDIDALLYLPERDLTKIAAALRIPALSPGWQQSFRDMQRSGSASPAGAAPPRLEPAWPGWRELKVTKVVAEATGVASIYLRAADGSALPHPRGGQYVTLRIPGAGEPAPIRTYSLSSPPEADPWRISVKQEAHGQASTYLTSRLRPGETLAAAAPRGEFVLGSGSGPVVLVTAGIGITPVLAMLHELAAAGSAREVWWIHSARSPHEQPLAAEAQDLISRLRHAHAYLTYTAASESQRRDAHAGAGRLTEETLGTLGIPADSDAYVCGPQAFMDGMESTLAGIGIDPARVHTERFGALAATNPGVVPHGSVAPHQPPGPPGTGPLVTFARSGISAPFPERGTVLEFAEACDVPTRWSCRTGVCHTCITSILSGGVRYSPEPVDMPVEGQVLICCSTPENDIVLDM